MPKTILLFAGLLLLLACNTSSNDIIYKSDTLTIIQLTDKTYLHITYLQTNDFGKVACNGMLVANQGKALIIDTPAEESEARELITWIKDELKSEVIGVIPTHFHVDCLGSLDVFHKAGITSYANTMTAQLAIDNERPVPQERFENSSEIQVGNIKVLNQYVGEGHTVDNIVSYIPSEKVLFGGCLIKSLGAGKGNLDDANVNAWPETVTQVKRNYSTASIIIPGHGAAGGQELLDYTIELFKTK